MAGFTITGPTANTGLGHLAGSVLAAGGTQNTLIGFKAGELITTGDDNVCIGFEAGRSLTTSPNNILIGSNAGELITTAAGGGNVAIGHNALDAQANATGQYSIAIGEDALGTFNAAGDNTAVGHRAGGRITTGTNNICIGQDGGRGITTGAGNICISGMSNSLRSHSGQQNIAIGDQALDSLTNGDANVVVGGAAGYLVNTGTYNTLIGKDAGGTLTTGSNVTCIGFDAEPTSATTSNEVTLGDTSVAKFRVPGIGIDATDDRFKTTGHFAGSAPVIITADHTVADSNYWLINNKSGSTCTLTLPAAASWTGRILNVKTIQAQTVVSASSNVKPIDTDVAGTAILTATAGQWATLVSDGTNWVIMARG